LKVEHASPQVNVAPVFEEQALNIWGGLSLNSCISELGVDGTHGVSLKPRLL
jgi:hypothetical protein